MGKLRDRLKETRFHCAECDLRFDAEPARLVDAPEDAWHPWRYFADCPRCKTEAPQERQARHLLKMWANATGPKTPEGIAAVTKNLEGHPTPEEAQRTRFNGLKHGLTARTATYWPARPGGYPHCQGCEYLDNLCLQQTACLKRTELFMVHHIAFESGDPRLLNDLNAELHANLRAIVNDMILAVIGDGVRLQTPEWFYDKDGGFHLAEYIDERTGLRTTLTKVEEHPLLKRIGEFVSRFGLDLNSQGMTPKQIEPESEVSGHLAGEGRPETAIEFQQRQAAALERMEQAILRSREAAQRDPILLQHEAASDAE